LECVKHHVVNNITMSYFDVLPDEIVLLILTQTTNNYNCLLTCKRFRDILNNEISLIKKNVNIYALEDVIDYDSIVKNEGILEIIVDDKQVKNNDKYSNTQLEFYELLEKVIEHNNCLLVKFLRNRIIVENLNIVLRHDWKKIIIFMTQYIKKSSKLLNNELIEYLISKCLIYFAYEYCEMFGKNANELKRRILIRVVIKGDFGEKILMYVKMDEDWLKNIFN